MEKAVWYAIYTKPRWEKKVAEQLTKKGIENYCPLNKVVRQWSDRKKTVLEPLFTSYVFVCITQKDMVALLETSGVLNLLYWLGKPAVIRDSEIAAIKSFLLEHENVSLEKMDVKLNDTVRITHGPLIAREGNVIEINNHTIKVVLPTLGYALIAQVSKTHIEKVKVLEEEKGYVSSLKMIN